MRAIALGRAFLAGSIAATLRALLPVALGCGSPQADEGPRPIASRRSDPQPYVPPPLDGAPRSGRVVGLVAEGSRLDVVGAALAVVQAIVDEDLDVLMALVAEGQDLAVGTAGRTVPRSMLRDHFDQQFALLDFHQFTLEEVVDRERVEVVPFESPGTGTGSTGPLRTGDVLVRLQMRVTERNRRRYFEDVYEWWFRESRGRWQIVVWGD